MDQRKTNDNSEISTFISLIRLSDQHLQYVGQKPCVKF